MLANIKQLIKHSAVYSIGQLATKATGVILLPLYTSHFSLAEYGVLAVVEVSLAIGVEVLLLGQGTSLLYLGNLEEYRSKKDALLFSVLVFLSSLGVAVVSLLVLFADDLAALFSISFASSYIRSGALIVALRVLNEVCMSKLRSEEQSVAYALTSLARIGATLGLSVYFVAFARLGIAGILYAYVGGELFTVFLLLPRMVKFLKPRFDIEVLSATLRFSIPLVFASLATVLLSTSDRYLLSILTTSEEVALYDLGYRVAGFVNMLLIIPFNLALPSIASKMYQQPGDKRYFSKLMTYLTYLIVWSGLALSLFSREFISVFALNPSYWPAHHVVPFLVLAYVFMGMRYVAVLGLFLTKRTNYIAGIVTVVVILNIGLNVLLIPYFSKYGAAVGSIVGSFFLFLLSKIYSDKYYKIPYEHAKLAKIILIGTFFYVIFTLLGALSVFMTVLVKLVLVALFPVALYLWRFYEPVEVQTVREILQRPVTLLFGKKSPGAQ